MHVLQLVYENYNTKIITNELNVRELLEIIN